MCKYFLLKVGSIIFAPRPRQENVYPKGASVQFYKLYLDPSVRRHVTEYDALAIIEWDVLVAHNTRYGMCASLFFIPWGGTFRLMRVEYSMRQRGQYHHALLRAVVAGL